MNTSFLRSAPMLGGVIPFLVLLVFFSFHPPLKGPEQPVNIQACPLYEGSQSGSLMPFPLSPLMVPATASNTGPYCAGATIQLLGGPANQLGYAWSGPGGYSTPPPVIQTVTQVFDALLPATGSVTWTDNGTVPGWYAQRTGTGTDIAADDGTASAGNLYSYGTGTNSERGLGSIGSGNAAVGSFAYGYLYHNTTGQAVTKILISYTLEQWRNSSSAAQTVSFYYKTSPVSITNLEPGTSTGWTLVPALSLASPVTGGAAGPLDGNAAPNRVTVSGVSVGTISIPNGEWVLLKWDDPDHPSIDHGLAIDDITMKFSTVGIQNPTRPASTVAMSGVYTITVTDATSTTSTASTTVTVNAVPTPNAGSYGPVCATAPNITLSGTPSGGTWSGPGVVNGNQFDPSANTQTITYSVTVNGCTGNSSTTITVNPCYQPPEMRFVLLNDNGQVNGSCVSQSDCDLNKICFGLQYTPNLTGTLTSYTTGFVMNCIGGTGGSNPVISNASCVMTNNSLVQNACASIGLIQWSFSGNTGNVPVVAGTPKILHQVCFVIPNSGSVTLTPFPPPPEAALTTSIDVSGGGPQSEIATFQAFSFDSTLYCGILPVRYLSFEAKRYDELQSKLNWNTAQEINNAYFEVQRSNDKGLTFTTIGRVNAIVEPRDVNKYEFIDESARPGDNYYRLKQYDTDGKYNLSPIRSVTFTSTSFTVRAFPSPVSDLLSVYISHAENPGHFELIDLAGRKAYESDFKDGDSSHEIPVGHLTSGVYTLVALSGTNSHIEKIVILH